MTGAPLRIAVADDAYLIREAVDRLLETVPEVEVVAACADGDALLAAVDEHRPDLVLTDMRMPPGGDEEGLRVARHLRARHPGVALVVLTQHLDPGSGAALLDTGPEGRGYVLKDRLHDRAELVATLQVVAAGGSVVDPDVVRAVVVQDRAGASPLEELTPRELEVLAQMARGRSNAAIAEALVLTTRAVEKHVGSIFLKLGLRSEEQVSRRVAAVLVYLSGRGHAPPPTGRVTPPPD